MKYKLTVQAEDYAFIKEAIKLRALILTEALEKQTAEQDELVQCQRHFEEMEKKRQQELTEAPVKAEGAPFTFIGEPKKKKPHWTQTAKGKKIMAARKRKGTK
jgi:hypothetical protein